MLAGMAANKRRGRGRPRKNTKKVNLSVPERVWEEICKLAIRNERNASQEATVALRKHLADNGIQDPAAPD